MHQSFHHKWFRCSDEAQTFVELLPGQLCLYLYMVGNWNAFHDGIDGNLHYQHAVAFATL